MKIKPLIILAVSGSLMVINGAALAESAFFGLGFGNASWDLTPYYGNFELEDGTATKLYWGARNEKNFGAEISLAVSNHDWKPKVADNSHYDSNFVVAFLGYLPLASTFDLYGKAGINFWHTRVDFLGGNYDGDKGIGFMAGFGLNVGITPKLLLRLDYDYLPGLGDSIDSGDITMTTVSLAYVYK